MSDTGLIYITSAANNTGIGTEAWSNPSNAVTDDSDYAHATGSIVTHISNYLIGTFTHGLVSTDTVQGIEIAYKRGSPTSNNYCDEESIRLVKNGTVSGSTTVGGNAIPASSGWSSTYGGPTDLWGLTFMGSDTIGLAIAVDLKDKNEVVRIYSMRMTIYYTAAGDAYAGGHKKIKTVFIGC